ncbi:hypothetical protein JAAARDRAFT_162538 [Jaapia argillacea MUCL 33604]|uniref:Uncharacterized protein n=1 Tax=Jaapia argillacea MUCL 33604 TaxID=933084 RepID=A0A067PD49_9AGAM|nr:hypothetical protein JAAARDRAFT_162538 [Jaapia argillacea MUCL 33604]
MTASRSLFGGGLEQPMLPTDPQPPTSKRKAADEGNPLFTGTKRVKKEGSTKGGSSNKRKLINGEEQPGGLVIVRAPPARPPSVPPPSSQPPPQSQHPPRPQSTGPYPTKPPSTSQAGPSQPPSKKFRADSRPPNPTTTKVPTTIQQPPQSTTRPDPELDEDVRLMNSEAEHLRQQSRVQAENLWGNNINPNFAFPAFPKSQPLHPSNGSIHHRDMSQPLAARETPTIERNRSMRGESHHRRRSSVSRGKRVSASFEQTGVITQPHPSVSDSSFYKHIDCDLPEPQRARQLLIWCSSRAAAPRPNSHPSTPEPSSSRRKSSNPGKDPPPLPPLSPDDAALLKELQDDVIRMLAEKRIDTNVFSVGGVLDGLDVPPKKMRENEQNVKNRAREIKFTEHNERAMAEDQAWGEVATYYNQHRARVMAETEKMKETRARSAKAKGKQRAMSQEVEDWGPRDYELPEEFRGSEGVALARSIVGEDGGRTSPLSRRVEECEPIIDHLHALVDCSLRTTHLSEEDLDRRFALLSLSLATRSQPIPSSSLSSTPGTLSSYLPPSTNPSRVAPPTDPQDLLRALSRIDAERPQAKVGDAARRAVREVQRVNEASAAGGVVDRRLTGVPPPTPRKLPGTPRRATTPGRGR